MIRFRESRGQMPQFVFIEERVGGMADKSEREEEEGRRVSGRARRRMMKRRKRSVQGLSKERET